MSNSGELAGTLNQRVRFERRVEVRGPGGDWAGDWEQVGARWAAVELLSDGSVTGADALRSARRWRVTLRVGLVLAVGMRMLWRGMALRVASAGDDPALAGRVVVVVEEDRG